MKSLYHLTIRLVNFIVPFYETYNLQTPRSLTVTQKYSEGD